MCNMPIKRMKIIAKMILYTSIISCLSIALSIDRSDKDKIDEDLIKNSVRTRLIFDIPSHLEREVYISNPVYKQQISSVKESN